MQSRVSSREFGPHTPFRPVDISARYLRLLGWYCLSHILASRCAITEGEVAAIFRPVSASLSSQYRKMGVKPDGSSKEFVSAESRESPRGLKCRHHAHTDLRVAVPISFLYELDLYHDCHSNMNIRPLHKHERNAPPLLANHSPPLTAILVPIRGLRGRVTEAVWDTLLSHSSHRHDQVERWPCLDDCRLWSGR